MREWQRRSLRGRPSFRASCFLVKLLRERNASEREASLHGLVQSRALIPRWRALGAVPHPLDDVWPVAAKPILNELGHVGGRLVDAACVAFLEICSMRSQKVVAAVVL